MMPIPVVSNKSRATTLSESEGPIRNLIKINRVEIARTGNII
jgi:hypothetical protein